LILVAMELDNPEDWAPLPELIHPVVQGGLGHNDHVGTRDAPELMEVSQQGNGLKGLAQALLGRIKVGFPCAEDDSTDRYCIAHSGVSPAHTQCRAFLRFRVCESRCTRHRDPIGLDMERDFAICCPFLWG